jgi:hypothetical protein
VADDIKLLQQMIMHGGTEAFNLVPKAIRKIITEKQWQSRLDRNGKPFTSFEAFVTHKLWWGLESSIDDLCVFCHKTPEIEQLVLAEMDPGREHRRPTKEEQDNKGSNTTFIGRGATYVMKRLKRDRPDLFQKVIDGHLSANEAAIKAGFRKKPEPIKEIRKLIRKCNEDDLKILLKEIRELLRN